MVDTIVLHKLQTQHQSSFYCDRSIKTVFESMLLFGEGLQDIL